jgi:putative transposase
VLVEQIRAVHRKSRHTYGAPRIHINLRRQGVICAKKRVARLMRIEGICGVHARKKWRTTIVDKNAAPAPDLVNRNFTATAPDRLWVADIKYVETWAGWLYLAAVIDVFTRACVGWALVDHLRTELVLEALDMAFWRRSPGDGLIFHSDRGSQFTSIRLGHRLDDAGVAASMGSRGDAYDNALAESFFATVEKELLRRHRYTNKPEARFGVFDYIEGFYNTPRGCTRRSECGHLRTSKGGTTRRSARHSPKLSTKGVNSRERQERPLVADGGSSLARDGRRLDAVRRNAVRVAVPDLVPHQPFREGE